MASGILFPPSPVPGAYELPEGYAHWALPWVVHFWQLVFVQALESIGSPAAVPPHVFDCSTEDGDTPPGHPGNAHDNFINLDIGYAMTDNPRGDFIIGPHRNNQLSGPPTLLDTRYQAAILSHAAILDREWGGLIVNVAVDPKAEAPLEAAIDLNELRTETKRTAKNFINSSSDLSWAKFHHHHLHARHYLRRDGDTLEEAFLRRLVTEHKPARTIEERLADVEARLGRLEAR